MWYDKQLEVQKGLCCICLKPGTLVLDHDHNTKRPRGLLHRTCNSALGLLGDDFEVLLRAAKYLHAHKDVV